MCCGTRASPSSACTDQHMSASAAHPCVNHTLQQHEQCSNAVHRWLCRALRGCSVPLVVPGLPGKSRGRGCFSSCSADCHLTVAAAQLPEALVAAAAAASGATAQSPAAARASRTVKQRGASPSCFSKAWQPLLCNRGCCVCICCVQQSVSQTSACSRGVASWHDGRMPC